MTDHTHSVIYPEPVGSQDSGASARPSGAEEIIRIAATAYRRRALVGLPLATFGDAAEQALALVDSGEMERHERGVALAPSVRLALAGQPVLSGWLDDARQLPSQLAAAALEAIREELRLITRWAAVRELPPELTQRAAELAGVLATNSLDPQAMTVVASSGGAPARQLRELLALGEGRCSTLKELRTEISRFVSTIHLQP